MKIARITTVLIFAFGFLSTASAAALAQRSLCQDRLSVRFHPELHEPAVRIRVEYESPLSAPADLEVDISQLREPEDVLFALAEAVEDSALASEELKSAAWALMEQSTPVSAWDQIWKLERKIRDLDLTIALRGWESAVRLNAANLSLPRLWKEMGGGPVVFIVSRRSGSRVVDLARDRGFLTDFEISTPNDRPTEGLGDPLPHAAPTPEAYALSYSDGVRREIAQWLRDRSKLRHYRKLVRALKYLQEDPFHPGLNSKMTEGQSARFFRSRVTAGEGGYRILWRFAEGSRAIEVFLLADHESYEKYLDR